MNPVALTNSTLPVPVVPQEGTSTHFFDGHPVTVVLRAGEPWFVAGEVADRLGHRSGSDVTRLLKEKHKGTHSVRTPGGVQSVTVISEAGFYQAVLSRKPSAKAMPGMVESIERFQDWVTEEVLPSIRRTGSYATPAVAAVTAPAAFDPEAYLSDMRNLVPFLAGIAGRLQVAEAKVEAAQPAVEFCEALADSDGLWGLRASGKALGQGPDKFIGWLRERGDIFTLNGGPVAKQPLIDRGLYAVVWEPHGGKPRPKTKITGKGILHYAKALGVRPPPLSKQGLLPGL